MTQTHIRNTKRTARKNLLPEQRQTFSERIAKHFLASRAYHDATHIGAYLALPEEVSVQTIIDTAWSDRKYVYLPVVRAKGQAMSFAPYAPDTPLTKDNMHIDIPDVEPANYLSANRLDLVITPLVAFDQQCNRIGMGGGFYDRTFAFKKDNSETKPLLIGVAFEIQRVHGAIQSHAWDVTPSGIITEVRCYSADSIDPTTLSKTF